MILANFWNLSCIKLGPAGSSAGSPSKLYPQVPSLISSSVQKISPSSKSAPYASSLPLNLSSSSMFLKSSILSSPSGVTSESSLLTHLGSAPLSGSIANTSSPFT